MSTSTDFDFPMSDNWRQYYDNRVGDDYAETANIAGLDSLTVAPQLILDKGHGEREQRYYVYHGAGDYNRDTALKVAKRCLDHLCEYWGWELQSWQAFRRAGEDSDFFWIRFVVSEGGYRAR